ncbi:hypothetical protein ACFWMJ_16615 [Streptomyces hawaiiensis]|uniref:hypothetical protein n=1 Tax=Streptomyces hawaiiensis TaxID=67305 RepID=UPI0036646CF4
MSAHEALIIGVGKVVAEAPEDEEPEPGVPSWGPLDFVPRVLPQVAAAVRGLGYAVTTRMDPSCEDLRSLLDERIGHRIIHVMSHGYQADRWDPSRLDVIPADGRISGVTNVSNWMSTAQAQRRRTLFLLDLCGAGRTARLPSYLHEAGRDTYAWVIAAADATEDAYDGRFSAAVAEVLGELAVTGLGTDPARRFVSFSLVARRLGQRLEEAEGRVQTVRATLMDPSADEPELPFFPNPLFVDSPERRLRAVIDPPVREFLDELDPLDSQHFADKAGRHFTGRRSQLRRLVPWLDNAEGTDRTSVCVVAGSPGTGKSALLGALVCTAHPALSDRAHDIRDRLEPDCRPLVHPRLAAVQARQRTLGTLMQALAGQLRLTAPKQGWTPERFLAAVGALATRPTLVIDALDEALDPGAVTDRLLLPLAELRGRAGTGCRIMVGMRPWTRFTRLREIARDHGVLIDLDLCDPDELRDDVGTYLDDVLGLSSGYGGTGARAVREALTRTAASQLVSSAQGATRWGEFLVASVFARYLMAAPPACDAATAALLGAKIPSNLPDVLEMDLRARPNALAGRALLFAFSHAKGDGMPAELAYRIARCLHPQVTERQLADALDMSLFYLRTGIDLDGTTLYRPFHQGLADYLRTRPSALSPARGQTSSQMGELEIAELIWKALLGRAADSVPVSTPDAPQRRFGFKWLGERANTARVRPSHHDSAPPSTRPAWAMASPYMLRHGMQHAQEAGRADELIGDADFLVHAAPNTVPPALPQVRTPQARLAGAVYRASLPEHRRMSPEERRHCLIVDAARYGARALQEQLTRPLPPGAWQTSWATGAALDSTLLDTFRSLNGGPRVMKCTVLEGRPIAVTDGGFRDSTILTWDLTAGELTGRPLQGHTSRVSALTCTVIDGRPVVVSAGERYEDEGMRVWDLATGEERNRIPVRHTNGVQALASAELEGRTVVVAAAGDGTVGVWDAKTGAEVRRFGSGHPAAVTALDCTVLNGQPTVVTASADRTVRVWDLATGEPLSEPLTGHTEAITALACAQVQGRPVAVTGSDDLTARIWDISSGHPTSRALTGHGGYVSAVACAVLEGRPVAVTGAGDRTVRIWDLVTGRLVRPPLSGHRSAVRVVDSVVVKERPIVVTAAEDGTVRLWDPFAADLVGQPLQGHTEPVRAVACTMLDGRPVALTGSDDCALRVWDVAAGKPVGKPLIGHGGPIGAVACTTLDERPVAVTGALDHRTLRSWDLHTGRHLREFPLGNTGIAVSAVDCTVMDGQPIAVTGSTDHLVRVWDVATGREIRRPFAGHTRPVNAVACSLMGGRPVVVSGSDDRSIRIWDLSTGEEIGAPLTGHSGPVEAIACMTTAGRLFAVTGSVDRTARLWDLEAGHAAGEPLTGHTKPITSVVCSRLGNRPVAVTGSTDRTVRLWDLGRGTCEVLRLPHAVGGIALTPDGPLVVGSGPEVVVMQQKGEPG